MKSQRELDARDAAKIKEGRSQVGKDGLGCTDCHKFRGEGKLGNAPELTGYGSREWLIGVVSNPAHRAILRQEKRPDAGLRPVG